MSELEPDSSATRRLLRSAVSGDRGAFNELFARHHRALHRFLELRFDRRLRSRLDPSDLVQETQLQAFGKLNDYVQRRPMPFRLWLQKTAYERLHKARRRHVSAARRSVDREFPLPDHASRILARRLVGESAPAKEMSRQETIRRVGEAIGDLGDIDREILLMRTYEGLSYEEVACLLGIEPTAARKRYGRALLRLRKVLDNRGFLDE